MDKSIFEEITLLKQANPEELYTLIASDPGYYIGIIENYTDENLQDLFNLKIRRENDKLLLKFKIYPEDRWTEVGYFNNSNTDKETFEEFEKHIEILLNRNRTDNRSHLDAEIKDNTLNDLNKLHQNIESSPLHQLSQTPQLSQTSQLSQPPVKRIRELDQEIDIADQNKLLEEFLNIILDQIAVNIPKWLDFDKIYSRNCTPFVQKLMSLYKECPGFIKKDYLHLVEIVKNPENNHINDHIYQTLFEPDFSHTKLCDLLTLEDNDRVILDLYNINLLTEWNKRCN